LLVDTSHGPCFVSASATHCCHQLNVEARAIDKLDQRARKPTREKLIELVAQFRASGKNLKPLLKMSGKPELADELWPLLERKLDRALAKRTETRIPVVPVIDEAMRMAQEYGRGNTVIALTSQ
jgi:hypothetical protein